MNLDLQSYINTTARTRLEQPLLGVIEAQLVERGINTRRYVDAALEFAGEYQAFLLGCQTRLQERGYITMLGDLDVCAYLPNPEYLVPQCLVKITAKAQYRAEFDLVGEYEAAVRLHRELQQYYPMTSVPLRLAVKVDRYSAIEYETMYLSTSDAKRAKNIFYPWLTVPLAEYFDAFMRSDENVLVLFGPPGNGKSTFIRSLILHTQAQAMLTYNEEVARHPDLLNRFFNGTSNLLAFEDADDYLGARTEGNELMPSILNGLDGVKAQKGKKLIFSTNLNSVNKIDPALLRAGRCFDILHFRNLTVEESNTVRHSLGWGAHDENRTRAEYSLAETLQERMPEQQAINRFAKKAGFL